MSTTIHNVKGSELSARLRKQANVTPDELLEITIDAEGDTGDGLLPPEEDFRPEFIAKIKQSDEDVKAGRVKRCESFDELKADLNKIWNE